jgi:hypothetical protein
MLPCNLSRGVNEADLTLQSSDLVSGAGNGEVRVPKKISRIAARLKPMEASPAEDSLPYSLPLLLLRHLVRLE